MGVITENKLDEFHYHELLDRLHVQCDNIDRHLLSHPVCDEESEIKEIITKCLDDLFFAYQKLGEKTL